MSKNNKQAITPSANKLYRPFLYVLMAIALFGVLYLLKPYLTQIIMAAMFAAFSFPVYRRLSKVLLNRQSLSALIMTLILLFIIVVPLSQFLIYGARQAPEWINTVQAFIQDTEKIENNLLALLPISADSQENMQAGIAGILDKSGDWLINQATNFLGNISLLFVSMFIFLLSYFYFLLHAHNIKAKILYYCPLEKKYTLEIIDSFKNISRTTFWSIGVSAIIQGVLSAISLAIIGWPFLLVFIVSAILAIIPYALILFYFPIALYLLASGDIWQAALIIVWNMLIVVNFDEIIKAYVSKGGTTVNMAFMLFAILGGIALFGLAGVFIGPLITVMTLKVVDIYGRVYSKRLKG